MASGLGVIFGLGFELLDLDVNCLILPLQAEGGETTFSLELRNKNLAVAWGLVRTSASCWEELHKQVLPRNFVSDEMKVDLHMFSVSMKDGIDGKICGS